MKSLLYIILLFCSNSLLAQQPGTLDPTFGNDGIVTISTLGQTDLNVAAIQTDGKIVIATADYYQNINTMRVDRLLPDGSKDLSFGTNGTTYILFPGVTASEIEGASPTAIAVLPDNKILVVGVVSAAAIDGFIGLARLTSDGTTDSSFSNYGTSVIGFGNLETAKTIALQPDGKIVLGGEDLVDFTNGIYHFFTVRCLPDGKIDEGYGNKGILLSKTVGTANAVAIQPDGKIVAAGYSGSLFNHAYFHIERYNANGSYDKTFGDGDGIVDTTVGSGSCSVNSIALQADGKIVAGGGINGYFPTHFAVARYNSDGSIDKSFGGGGVVSEFNGVGSEATKVLLIKNGKEDRIVVTGTLAATGGSNFTLVAYNMDGTKAPSFGNEGVQTTDLGGVDNSTQAILQPDGKIVLIGFIYNSAEFSYTPALTRYYGYPQQVPLLVRIKRWLQNHTLSWKGLPAEDNIAYYTVEQSSNSNKGFTPVAKVSGAANLKDYSITNSHLLQGANYYRIKAVSTDGVIRYSEVVSADNMANTASVYPNPAKNYVTVQGLPTDETAHISIANGSGTVKARGVSNGAAQYRSAVNSLQPGTYYVNITTGSKTETLKFVKE